MDIGPGTETDTGTRVWGTGTTGSTVTVLVGRQDALDTLQVEGREGTPSTHGVDG